MKRIAVLTSGGDAPGMNACIRAVVRTCISKNIEPYIVYDGYKGLVEGRIQKVGRRFVSEVLNRGGTIIGTARLNEFDKKEVRLKAINNLKKHNIDGLVVIGGDGTIRGANELYKEGVRCVAVAATIDNDINTKGYTIGFDTALNTITSLLDKIRDTSSSHNRCSIVEVMGRDCGDLALYSGIACGADIIITKEKKYDREVLYKEIRKMKEEGRRHVLIVTSENILNVEELAKDIQRETGFETRSSIFGHLQRGGVPSAMDRVNGSLLGGESVNKLINGEYGKMVYLLEQNLKAAPFEDVTKEKSIDIKYMYEHNAKVG